MARVIVKFWDGTTVEQKVAVLSSFEFSPLEDIPELNIVIAETDLPKPEMATAMALMVEDAANSVYWAEEEYSARVFDVPDDPFYKNQYYLEALRFTNAWATSSGEGVKVAVVDSGINDHDDLAGKVVARGNFTSNLPEGDGDFQGHGTGVASIIAAVTSNALGMAGCAPGALILDAKVVSKNPNGIYEAPYYSIASAIVWSIKQGARVINLSLGGYATSNTLQDAVKYAWDNNAVVVAAAGNDHMNQLVYPAACQNAIAVGSCNQLFRKSNFSNYGSWVHVAAMGEGILQATSYSPTQYFNASGTSFAAPMVSALAALLWTTPFGISNLDVRQMIFDTAIYDATQKDNWAYGTIDALNAVTNQSTPRPSSAGSGAMAILLGLGLLGFYLAKRKKGIDTSVPVQK